MNLHAVTIPVEPEAEELLAYLHAYWTDSYEFRVPVPGVLQYRKPGNKRWQAENYAWWLEEMRNRRLTGEPR